MKDTDKVTAKDTDKVTAKIIAALGQIVVPVDENPRHDTAILLRMILLELKEISPAKDPIK